MTSLFKLYEAKKKHSSEENFLKISDTYSTKGELKKKMVGDYYLQG